ncbi:hypothetical protein N7481_007744 [Penicillium waksmanii]|uniref:uncharacterized protein n=1 Tax=Penicillium waksmanii TaxID=69791 RepID=UPI0025473905|nr:uncharacterized protein N7481_007744 [Penicillium waksmanii]KAJ5980446.1 hypothetical protein N7481_007744 [Penicillium waksmanii]
MMSRLSTCILGCCTAGSESSNHGDHASHHSGGSQKSDDSEATDDPDVLRLRHARFKEHGSQRRRWMEDPNEPDCFVAQATIDWETLSGTYDLNWLGLPARYVKSDQIIDHRMLGLDTNLDFLEGSWGCDEFSWWGYTAPGIIVMMGIRRDIESTTPQISEVNHAIYTKDHPIDSLKQVYLRIGRHCTLPFIRKHVYTEANNLTWPTSGEQIWEFATNSDMFDMILGTRIGKVVSYLVLGSFPRGTRHIAQIVTILSFADTVHLRFDIEAIE